MRLAWAKYYDPKLENPREYFAWRIKAVAPEVAADLRESVWPIYGQVGEEGRGFLLAWQLLEDAKAYPSSHQAVKPVEDAIIAWAERYHLGREFWTVDAEWVYDAALHTLDRWQLEPEALETGWFGSQRIGWDAEALESPPSPPAYNPVFDERSDYLERVKRYMDEIERQAGLLRAPRTQTPRHFDWLVLRHVCGYSAEHIGYACGVERKSVDEAIKITAQSIGLKRLASLEVGRKPGYSGADYREQAEEEIRRRLADFAPPY